MTRRRLLGRAALVAAATALPKSLAGAEPLAAALSKAARMERLRSLVVAVDGEVVAARAFRGPGVDRPANVKSVSKTVVALLAGIAIDRGLLPGVEATLGEVAPRLIPKGADPRVRDIRVGDLLTMRSGLERTSGANYGRWVQSPDWVAFALSRPVVAEPGGPMLYSTGNTHVIGAVLAELGRRDLRRLAQDWLGRPLEIDIPPWTRDPQGRYFGGNNMLLSPVALLQIGEMVRQGGSWRGRRIVSTDWLQASLAPRTVSPWSGDAYGYGWFLRQGASGLRAYGRGYGGQLLYVAPAERATIVITSDPNRPARSGGYIDDLHSLVADQILPAIAG